MVGLGRRIPAIQKNQFPNRSQENLQDKIDKMQGRPPKPPPVIEGPLPPILSSSRIYKCEHCRRIRKTCDGKRPSCDTCRKKKINCVYSDKSNAELGIPTSNWKRPRKAASSDSGPQGGQDHLSTDPSLHKAHAGSNEGARPESILSQLQPRIARRSSYSQVLQDGTVITDAYFLENTITHARVHPRMSNILVVDLGTLESILGPDFNRLPEIVPIIDPVQEVLLAKKESLGSTRFAQPTTKRHEVQAVAIAVAGIEVTIRCNHCDDTATRTEKPVFHECRRTIGFLGGACNNCVYHGRGQDCSYCEYF